MGKTNDINLDGAEISVIKAIGLHGAEAVEEAKHPGTPRFMRE